jgi:hypothetical protein
MAVPFTTESPTNWSLQGRAVSGMRAPGHRDRTKRRIPITDFGGCRSRIPGHRDRTKRRIPIT